MRAVSWRKHFRENPVIIQTRNSTYRLAQNGAEVTLTKIQDHYEGGHPNTSVGDVYRGTNPRRPVIGKSFWLRGDWGTSSVVRIEAEPGDESLRFRETD